MSFNLIVTSFFEKDFRALAKKYPSIKSDLAKLIEQLIENPTSGVPLGKDCYKIRLAISSKGRGKSGGARVITCVKVVRNTIFLLKVYDKSQKSTVDDSELDLLLKPLGLG